MKQLNMLVAICLSSVSLAAQACTYDGQFSNPFTESYPGSLDVAMSTYDALDSQTIDTISSLNGPSGLRRASWWLKLMADKYASELQSVSYIYLVDSHLWSKVEHGQSITVHSAPSDESSSSRVLLLSEAALNALVQGKVSFEQGITLGVIQKAG